MKILNYKLQFYSLLYIYIMKFYNILIIIIIFTFVFIVIIIISLWCYCKRMTKQIEEMEDKSRNIQLKREKITKLSQEIETMLDNLTIETRSEEKNKENTFTEEEQ